MKTIGGLLAAIAVLAFVHEAIGPDVASLVAAVMALAAIPLIVITAAAAIYDFRHYVALQRLDLSMRQVALQRDLAHLHLVAPDDRGLFPLPLPALDHPQIQGAALAVADQFQRSRIQLPQTITYSPHYSNKGLPPADAAPLALPAAAAPDFWRLVEEHKLPANGFLLGYDAQTNEPVIADWQQLYSALVGGQSGSGKSTAIRGILAQSALQGGQFLVVDPHYGAGEESLGASLDPLRGLMLADVASDDRGIVEALRYVVDVGRRRLAGAGDHTPIVLIVDEVTALFQRSAVREELDSALRMIATETRKVGVYAFCIGQNFHGEIMPTTARDNFVSMYGCRMRKNIARVMSGNNEFAKIAETLTIGQAVWQAPSGETRVLAVPNCTQEHLARVASKIGTHRSKAGFPSAFPMLSSRFPHAQSGGVTAAAATNGKPTGNLKAERIIGLFREGKSPRDIAQDVYGVKSGRRYNDALDSIYEIIREAM